MIVFIYIVLVFLILRFSVTVFNFLSNPKLGHYGKKFDDKVSIIISPSSVDATELIQSISCQDYKNVEVLMVGSNEELSTTAANAKGRYLLFVDSCSVIKMGLLNSLIYRAKVFNLKLVVLIPNRSLNSFQDYLLEPIPDFVLLNLLPLRLVRLLNLPWSAAAWERHVFYDAESYKRRNADSEEGEKDEKKAETLLANGMILSNKRTSVNEASKQLLSTFDRNPLTIAVYLLFLIAGPLVLILNSQLAFISLPFGLIFLTRIMISFLTKQNPLINVILHPLQMVALTGLLISGTLKKLFTSGIHSKS
ncbi:hypothetical protein [Pedobacter sp. JCM 36344]|uniref:hypothetical protein n=1 Tax=Pedobacter sp. JCM 36344 TaxID=3374280 RepID=UPI0039797DAE